MLGGKFVVKDEEEKKYAVIDILRQDETGVLRRVKGYEERLRNTEFRKQINDIIDVGLARYKEHYEMSGERFVLYEKYTRRDVSFLMDAGRDYSSTMYGMKRFGDDVFLFVTYHKVLAEEDDRQFVEGKPDYADEFVSDVVFKWDSKIGCGIHSKYMNDVNNAQRKHLFVKKSDAEKNFYYMGQFDITDQYDSSKLDNRGKEQVISKVTMRMKNAVREDILRYLQSPINGEA